MQPRDAKLEMWVILKPLRGCSPSLVQLVLIVHLPYSITASSVTGRPLHRQNVTQNPVTGQENRKRHQEVPRLLPSP